MNFVRFKGTWGYSHPGEEQDDICVRAQDIEGVWKHGSGRTCVLVAKAPMAVHDECTDIWLMPAPFASLNAAQPASRVSATRDGETRWFDSAAEAQAWLDGGEPVRAAEALPAGWHGPVSSDQNPTWASWRHASGAWVGTERDGF